MRFTTYACLVALLIGVFAVGASAQLADSCWPKFRADAANTGRGIFGGAGSDLTWTYAAGGAIRSAPAVGVDGTIYVTCDDGYLYAISGAGTKLWSFQVDCIGTSSPAVAADGTIYAASINNFVYAIRPSGTLRWKRVLPSRVTSSFAIDWDGTIYFGCENGTFYSMRSDGGTKWTCATGAEVQSTAAIAPDGSVCFGSNDGKLYALYSNGTPKWTFAPYGAGSFTASPAVAADGTVYIGSTGGFFYAVRSNGTQRWRVTAGGPVYSSAGISPTGNIYYGCRDGKLHALSPNGIPLWEYATGHYIDTSPAIGVDGGIYVCSLDGSLYAVNPDGTARWSYNIGSAIYSSPAIGPAGCLLMGADDALLYCFAADTTPPEAPDVTDDGDFTSTLDRLHGQWSAADPESGIFGYEYCIGTAPGADDVAPWMNVGGATDHTRTGLALANGQTYYITARAINGAGLTGPQASSDGITVDATPPTRPIVTDDGRFTSISTSLHATWSSDDPESGIDGYEYSIGTSPAATNVVGWTDVGSAAEVTRTGLSLQTGVTYYLNVRSRNSGGAISEVGSSNGITVDATAPSTPAVIDAGQFISDEHSIFASWSSADNESGVTGFEYSVGTTPGGTQILAWTDAGVATQATITGLSLVNGITYYVNARATNGAGLVSTVGSSDGATLDITPPSIPSVVDDGELTSSTSELHASWSADDPQSGISAYKYAIGTSPQGVDVVDWTYVGVATSVTRSGLALADKQTYYFSVIAVNGAGSESQAGVSDGITVDATPPPTPVVTDDGDYTGENSQLHATWTCEDPESQIERFDYSIGTAPGASDVVSWTDIGPATEVTHTGLTLVDGAVYFINVRAYNTLQVQSGVGSSDGIIVDSAQPDAPVVTDDGVYTSSLDSLHAVWTAVTAYSGIASYEYSIGTSAGAADVRGWSDVGPALEVTASGLALENGQTYFINARGINSLGRAGAVGSSDGITVDATPPSTPAVTDDGEFTADASQLAASWTCGDPESGIEEFFYAVGTSPAAADIVGWTSAGTDSAVVISPLSLPDGGTCYVSVKAVNGAGAESGVGVSDGITVDLTPPTTPVVTDDGDFTIDDSLLHAVWQSEDSVSGIAGYEYSVGTAAGATDVVPWTDAGTAVEKTITPLALVSGADYYINVRATNGAGLVSDVGVSDGIYVEATPPTVPEVIDEADYTSSTTSLSAQWSAEDPESGVTKYEYCIGTGIGLDDVVPWTDAGLATSFVRSDLVLSQAVTYYVNVRATNGIGLVSGVGSSDGITVDTTPPGIPTITDDGDYTADNTRLHFVLDCVDEESGVDFYECAVGTTPGDTDVVDWHDCGPGPEITVTGLEMVHGSVYYISSRAYNTVGIPGDPGVSDGITIDTTPPVNLVVFDSGDYTGFADQLYGSWSASDPESGIGSYRYCIGTTPGTSDVADWLDVGDAVEHTRTGLSLAPDTDYYITVIAVNGAGGECDPEISDGIRLDITPPTLPDVADTGEYWGFKTWIQGTWSSEDPESGIEEYQVSVGTSPGDDDVAPWQSAGNNTSYIITDLQLSDGVVYYINVKARNGAGRWSAVGSSDGVLIDSTPPTTPVVTDDGDTTSVLDRLHAIWHSEDPESGIAEYVYCIGTSPGATDVVPWTSAGTSEDATVTGLFLDPELQYYFSVKARSNAGAWSPVSASDGIEFSSGAAIWWRFRNDEHNRGQAIFDATTVNDVGWIMPTLGYVESSPAIASDGTSYVGSGDGNLYAITQNGTIRWTYYAAAPIDSSPAIADDGRLCFGCNGGFVHCLNPAGEVEWIYDASGPVRSSPLIKDDLVYVGSAGGVLHVINLEDGTSAWQFSTGGDIWSSPAIDDDGIVYVASGDSNLYAIEPGGTQKWRFQTVSSVIGSPAVGPDGTVYFGSGDANFYAVKPDGTEKWRLFVGTVANSSPALDKDGNLYFGTGFDGMDGRLYAVRSDGVEIWHVDFPAGGIHSSPAVDRSGLICVGSSDGNMYAFNPDGSIQWTYTTGSSVMSSPAIGADSSVVFGSYDGCVYCLRDITTKDLTPPTTPVVQVPSPVLVVGSPLQANWIAEDPDTMVAEYVYAVGTTPEGTDIAGWTSAGIETSLSRDDLSLAVGETYYVSVKARNPSQRWSDIGVSEGVTVTDDGPRTIAEIKALADGTQGTVTAKTVTAVFADCFFIEEPDRSCGIRCVSAGSPLQAGDSVTVTGAVDTVNDEKVINVDTFDFLGVVEVLKPLGVTGSAVECRSPDTVGLYVKIWGSVTQTGDGFLVVDDGSCLACPRGVTGVEVWCSGSPAEIGQCIGASGVLCREEIEGLSVTILRVTCEDDICRLDESGGPL